MQRLETLESILERLRISIRKNGLKNSKQREEVVSVLYIEWDSFKPRGDRPKYPPQ